MPDHSDLLKLAVLARRNISREASDSLQEKGLELVAQHVIGENISSDLNQAQVMLVELGMHVDKAYLAEILDYISIPVFLYEGSIEQADTWNTQLIERLHRLVDGKDKNSSLADSEPLVIVLCASVGGPKAIGCFFEQIPADLPVVFLLVQHMAEEFQTLLGKQLSRITGARVKVLENNQTLQAGDAWIIPADVQITVDQDRRLKRLDTIWETVNRPSMDVVLEMVATEFGPNCGAIMFSGIGYDGLTGCDVIAEQGGFVWAQSADSCVSSRLPDSVRESGHVEISGSPEELAAALFQRCQTHYQASC